MDQAQLLRCNMQLNFGLWLWGLGWQHHVYRIDPTQTAHMANSLIQSGL